MRVLTHLSLWTLGLAAAETQTTAAERECLARHATGRRMIVEIGVWHGVTTRLLRSVKSPEGTLFAVDPFPVGRLRFSAQQRIARSEIGRVSNGRVEWVRLTGVEAPRRHAHVKAAPVDFIFIDGDHSYDGLRQDWEAWSPFIGENGIAALHDSRPQTGRADDLTGSVQYARKVILADSRFEFVEAVETLTILRRRSAEECSHSASDERST